MAQGEEQLTYYSIQRLCGQGWRLGDHHPVWKHREYVTFIRLYLLSQHWNCIIRQTNGVYEFYIRGSPFVRSGREAGCDQFIPWSSDK